MSTTDAYHPDRLRRILHSADNSTQFLFALSSAQRVSALATAVLDTFASSDRQVVDSALDSCWHAAASGSFRGLPASQSLWERMIPEDDPRYTDYNSVVNDVFAALIYTIGAATKNPPDSAYWTVIRLTDLADYLHNKHRDQYSETAPITTAAKAYITADVQRLRSPGPTDLTAVRAQLVSEGNTLAQLIP